MTIIISFAIYIYFFSENYKKYVEIYSIAGVRLELMTDYDMYTFIEANLRGGVTTVNHRHHKANNPYLNEFDPAEPTSYIHYIDAK